jgi:hypothetical protein
MGLYGKGLYGVHPRPGASSQAALWVLPPVYSIDNFGALLLVMASSDGRLLWWDPAAPAGTLLTQVTNAPPARCFVVTPARFVMLFGALTADGQGSARRFCWSDQGDPTNWNFSSVVSQAGFLDVEPASPIITAHEGRSGWVIFFTAKKAYAVRYLGLPYVYDYEPLADDCCPRSPQSIATTSSSIMWQSEQGFDQSRPVSDPLVDTGRHRRDAIAVPGGSRALGSFQRILVVFPAERADVQYARRNLQL